MTRASDVDEALRTRSVDAVLTELHRDGAVDASLASDLLEMAQAKAHSDPSSSRLSIDLCERLATEVETPEVVPEARYLRARLAVNDGRPDEALTLIAESKSLWLGLGRPLEASRTELGRMHVLDDLGRHGESIAAATVLLDDLEDLEPELDDDDREQFEWIRAAASENLGVAYGFTGQHERALAAYEFAEARYAAVGGEPDIARCHGNRGVELVAIGRAVEGLEMLHSAASRFKAIDDNLSYAQCLGHVADAELLLGLYAACLTRFEEARAILDELGARSEGCRLRLRTVRAYLALNLIEEAEREAAETASILDELSLDHDLAEARWLQATAELRLGHVGAARQNLDLAIEGAKRSDDPPLLTRALLTMSQALADLGDEPGALDASRQALTVAENGEWPTEELHVRLRMAQLVDETEQVESHLARAEQLADELRLPHLSYPVLLELGRYKRRLGGVTDARRWLQAAVDVVEGLRGLIPDEALRSSYLEGRTAAHVDLMSMLLVDSTEADRLAAYDLAEASKARTLADILAGVVQPRGLHQIVGDGTLESDVLDRYEADLDAAYGALSNTVSLLSDTRRKLVEDRAVELERTIRLAHLKREAGPRPLQATASVEPSRPRPDEQVVEYHVVGDDIVAFVWSRGRLDVVTDLASVDVVAELQASWDRQLERFQLARGLQLGEPVELLRSAEETLRRLWAAVFGPVLPALDHDDGRVLIVPHGQLHGVPFHALLGPDGPVANSWTTAIAPSYAVASRLGEPPRIGPDTRALVLGVPDEAAPQVEGEARFVAGALPGAELLLGQAATSTALAERVGDGCDVLHLACHGLHRPRNPMFSALKLDDRWLTAHDVLKLRLDDALVVLSACETGRLSGQRQQDEAIGLARSFLAAGATAVVVSLWLAGDDITAVLMRHFYQSLGAGNSVPEALRIAQAAVAADHPHPADWAPFIVHGRAKGEL